MQTIRGTLAMLLTVTVLFLGFTPAAAQALPPEAQKLIKDFEDLAAQVKKKAEEELAGSWTKLLADLTALQEDLTKKGNLDGALAVRNALNKLKIAQKLKGKPVLPDPGNLSGYSQAKAGEEVYFTVKGRTSGGSVWGSDLYTLDSHLAMVAVHAGVLKDGEAGIVKVTFAPGQSSYAGSDKNGVKSSSWGSYQLSYKVEAVTP
jgi:hypothetical protein